MDGDAVLIEIRPNVLNVLKNSLDALPQWTIHFWHSDQNILETGELVDVRFVKTNISYVFPREYQSGINKQNLKGWWKPREWYNNIITSPIFLVSF
jgi:hypothetical protein